MTTLDVVKVTKRYGAEAALDGVSARFEPGISVLLGRNGAGKTTLASIAGGWCEPDSGEVRLDGESCQVGCTRFLEVGVAPQGLAIYPTLTVNENLRVFADLAGYDTAGRKRRVSELTDQLAIGGLRDRPANTLSGGQQRCVHTAIALIADPGVVLLDEPTVGVDVEHRRALIDVVRALGREGRTVLYTTHYLAELDALEPDNVVVLDAGRVRYAGSVAGLLERAVDGDIVVEFDRAVRPPAHLASSVQVDGRRWELRGAGEAGVGGLIAALGDDAVHIRRLDVRKCDVEAAYLHLLDAAAAGIAEDVDVIAS